jgi:WD40 repeat protein
MSFQAGELLNIQKSFKVRFSPQADRLATLSRDVSIWDVHANRKTLRTHPLSHPSHCDFSPSGKQLAVKATSGRIVVIDSENGQLLRDYENSADGEGANLLYSSCGDYIVDASWAGRVFVRRVDSGEVEYTREFSGEMITQVHRSDEGRTWILQHTPKGKKLGDARHIYFSVWEWPFKDFRMLTLGTDAPVLRSRASAVTESGELLATVIGTPPKTLAVFRVADGMQMLSTDIDVGGTGSAITWSRVSQFIASVQNNKVVVYSAAGSLTRVFEYPLRYASDVAFAANGHFLAIGAWQGGLVLPFASSTNRH